MTDHIVLEYASIPPRPWKNGRGVTRTLFDDSHAGDSSAAASTGEDEWSWRISIAEITGEQPYSSYSGIRRGQVALGPGAVDLTINGQVTTLPPEGVIHFDGEDEVSALPHSAGFLDLNVMTRRDTWSAEVEIVDGPVRSLADDEVAVLIALADGCGVAGRDLQRLDSVLMGDGGSPEVAGHFVLARLHRR